MKSLSMVVAMLCLTLSAQAQLKLGVKASTAILHTPSSMKDFVNSSPIQVNRIEVGGTSRMTSIGMSLKGGNDKVFFTIDGLYGKSEEDVRLTSLGTGRTPLDPAKTFTRSSSNLRMVMIAGIRHKDISVGAGPEFNFILDEEEELSQLDGFEYLGNKPAGGFNFQVGYAICKRLQLDLRCVTYFRSTGSPYKFEGVPLELRSSPRMLELSLGAYL